MSQEQLESILKKGGQKACMKFFAKLSEKDRQGYAEQVKTWFKTVSKNSFIEKKPGHFVINPLMGAAEVAVQAACSFSDLKQFGWRALPGEDLLFEIFGARRPAWLDDWATWLCETMPNRWPQVRHFVRQGLCRAPETDHYILGMMVGVGANYRTKKTIYAELLEDKELLEKDVWRLFEVEGDKEFCLASREKYRGGDNTWSYALIRLSNEKKLARARLLDASLDTLQRDFAQFHAGWFSRFHEALEPTLQERAARSAAYLALLASKIPPTVSFALNALQILAKEDKVDAQALVDALRPALWSRHKGTARAALQLLDETGRKNPGLQLQIGLAITEALAHESPDVQKHAVGLLEKLGSPLPAALAKAVGDRMGNIAASQRARLQKLVAATAPAAREPQEKNRSDDSQEKTLRQRAKSLDKKWRVLAGVDELLATLDSDDGDLPTLDFDPLAVPRLDPDKRIQPIEDLDELIDAFAHVLEEPDDPMEVERVLDGVSRLCGERPDDFAARTGPLRKRALDKLARLVVGPFIGCGVLVDLCGIARAWLCGELVLPFKQGVHVYDRTLLEYEYEHSKGTSEFIAYHLPSARTFLSLRALAVAERSVAGKAAPLLAAPTHAGGWIDPRELVRRALAIEQESDPVDQIQALLRLAPDQRATALKAARKVAGEFGAALRYALGGDEKIGANASLWVAAARARSPFADDARVEKKHPGLGPDAGKAATYQAEIRIISKWKLRRLVVDTTPTAPKRLVPEQVTVVMNPQPVKHDESYHVETWESVADLRSTTTIWPMRRASWFAWGLRRLANNLDWDEAAWANRTLLEALLDPDVPLEPMAMMMLALGLAAKEPGENGLATDALIGAIDDGRLDPHQLGTAIASLTPLFKYARLARTFGQAARISPLHLQVVVLTIQAALRGDPADAPRDLQALLELLKESLLELGASVTDADARGYLEKIKTGGRTARLARELLALDATPDPSLRRQALLRALDHRIARAESWSRCSE